MDINFWNERWDKEEIAFHMNEVNPMLIKHFPKLSLEEQKRIFIPLCGKTLDIEWLLAKNYKIDAVIPESPIFILPVCKLSICVLFKLSKYLRKNSTPIQAPD